MLNALGEIFSGCLGIIAGLIAAVLTLAFIILGVGTLGVLIVSCLPIVIVVGFIFILFAVFAL